MQSRRTDVIFHSKNLRAVLLASAMAASVLPSGCNQASTAANHTVSENIASALPQINGSPADRAKAEASLRAALKETNASPEHLVYAKALLGQVELRSAEAMQSQIDSNQAALKARAWEIQQLAIAVGDSGRLSAALSKRDPGRALDEVKKNTTEAQGSAEQPDWIKSDTGSIASLASVNSDLSKLNDQVTQLQAKIKDLTEQHDKLEADADKLDQQSQQTKGDAGVKLFTDASNLRKQADDLNVQNDQAKVALARAQADVVVRTGQQTAVQSAVHDFGDVGNQLDQNWQAVQKQAQASDAQAKALMGEGGAAAETDPTGGATIAAKAERLKQLADTDAKLRSQALGFVNSGIDFLNQAITQAEQYSTSLKTRMTSPEFDGKPEQVAMKATIDAIDPGQLRLQLAAAQARRANLYAGQAAVANDRLAAADAVKAAADAKKLTVPDALTADARMSDDMTSARQSAATSYKDATDTLDKVAQGSAPAPDKDAAHLASMYAFYQWSLLDTATADKAGSSEHFKLAKDQLALLNTPPTQGLPPALAIAPKPLTAPAKGAAPGMTPGMGTPPTAPGMTTPPR